MFFAVFMTIAIFGYGLVVTWLEALQTHMIPVSKKWWQQEYPCHRIQDTQAWIDAVKEVCETTNESFPPAD